jgi:L,D-peptidoglycan transpeptidase YkuD (ErfK/YbiS/YcfS/YnhG family)
MAGEWIPDAGTAYAAGAGLRRSRGGILTRRRIVLAAILLAVLAAGSFVAWYAFDPPPLPVRQIDKARAAFRDARSHAWVLAKPEVEDARLKVAILERLVAEERAKLVRFSTNERIAQLAFEVERSSRDAIAKAEAITAQKVGESASQRGQLEARLAEIEPQVQALKGDRSVQRAYRRAEHSVEEVAQVERMKNLPMLATRIAEASEDVVAAEEALGKRMERFSDPTLRRRWQAWVDETLRDGGTVILVEKKRQKMLVVKNRKVIASYTAEFGRNGFSDKLVQGDAATPEGRYHVTAKKTTSRYYKALPLNYPTAADVAEYAAAKRRGLVRGRGPGYNIEIHGGGGKGTNWTDGCVAIRDRDMDRLFALIDSGTPVTIVGAARLPGD